jgi:hypothetical protein
MVNPGYSSFSRVLPQDPYYGRKLAPDQSGVAELARLQHRDFEDETTQ